MQEGTSSSSMMAAGKELSSLARIVSVVRQRDELIAEEASIRELLGEAANAGDDDLERECHDELSGIRRKLEKIERKLVDAVVPQDDDDYESDAIIEIRAGTGGDEASLFASELLEAYQRTAQSLNWQCELLNRTHTDIGGVREAALSISGSPSYRIQLGASNEFEEGGDTGADNTYICEDDEDEDAAIDDQQLLGPYGAFKFESGVHRVQRVPVNDSRIHTSACSVAVLPSLSSRNHQQPQGMELPPNELKIETMRSSGAGGQHVNTTDSAVRITHIPTGITASIQDERTQHANKQKALKLVAARVRDRQRAEEERLRGEARSSLMGGGDRSERIRTYNYPQDRVTDHRSKITKHGIESLLRGGHDDGLVVAFLPSLKFLRREELLEQLEEDEA